MPARPHLSSSRSSLLQARARLMRRNATPSEAVLFAALRGWRLGVAFRRQVVIGERIVDFLAPSLGLVVEVDGGWHRDRRRADARRDRALERLGYHVLRLDADVVLRDLPLALARVRDGIARLAR